MLREELRRRTEKLVVRLFREEDADALYRIKTGEKLSFSPVAVCWCFRFIFS